MDLEKPLPTPTPATQRFWSGLKDEIVTMQQCDDCSTWVFYPRRNCTKCLSTRLTWREVDPVGELYTFTVTRQATAPQFVDETPQRLGVVQLENGVRLTTTLVNVQDSDIHIGMKLRPVYDHIDDQVTMLRYEPYD